MAQCLRRYPIYTGVDTGDSNGEAIFWDPSGRMHNFHAKASGETGVIFETSQVQPWYFMNNQIYRNGEMMSTRRGLSTDLCVMAFVFLVAGLLILPWKRMEVILLPAGLALLLIGMYVAEISDHAVEGSAITIPYSPSMGLFV